MTTIEINNSLQSYEWKNLANNTNLNAHPDFKMIDETTATIGGYAIIRFNCNPENLEDIEMEKEDAADLCKRYTNGQILPALALMTMVRERDLSVLPDAVEEYENPFFESDKNREFYPFVSNEKELHEYLEDELIDGDVDEHMERFKNQYVHSPIGTIFLNF